MYIAPISDKLFSIVGKVERLSNILNLSVSLHALYVASMTPNGLFIR